MSSRSEPTNKVYIATSLDGYIADRDGGLEWLDAIPIPEGTDMGYETFYADIDAMVMGRHTFETVCSFDVDWPYSKPVFVLSHSMEQIPRGYEGKVEVLAGNPSEVMAQIHAKGYHRLYIDGGRTIQQFLEEDLIDEMVITVMPVLLGGGPRLFSEHREALDFELVGSRVFFEAIVQSHYRRKHKVAGTV